MGAIAVITPMAFNPICHCDHCLTKSIHQGQNLKSPLQKTTGGQCQRSILVNNSMVTIKYGPFGGTAKGSDRKHRSAFTVTCAQRIE